MVSLLMFPLCYMDNSGRHFFVMPRMGVTLLCISHKSFVKTVYSSRRLELLQARTQRGFEGVRTNPLQMLSNGGIGHGRNEQ